MMVRLSMSVGYPKGVAYLCTECKLFANSSKLRLCNSIPIQRCIQRIIRCNRIGADVIQFQEFVHPRIRF